MDSGLTEYRAALDALFARTGSTAKFGLERTLALLAAIGNPHDRFPAFHVAGTNGKGSVVATLYALLESQGRKVGRYTSPHLVDFRERLVVGGEPASEEYVVQFLDRWGPHAEELGATFFEITTAMAFHYFAISEVDVAVIETGLGGRLDSTNVIKPLVAGITSIGMDHQEYLGDTEAAIAREKAGIMKAGTPAVIGPLSHEARVAVYEVAQQNGVTQLIEAQRLYSISDVRPTLDGTRFLIEHRGERREMMTGLIGAAQADNTSVALSMLLAAGSEWTVSLAGAADVLPSIRIPGRFQRLGSCILDVAHNIDGIRSVIATLREIEPPRPLRCVLGVLADKDWRSMIEALGGLVSELVLVTPPSAPKARTWNPSEAMAFATARGFVATIEPDFEKAVRLAAAHEGTTLITGSFHTVGDALMILGERTF